MKVTDESGGIWSRLERVQAKLKKKEGEAQEGEGKA